MLYNFLLDDVGRKQLKPSKPNQNHRVESMELAESPTTALPRRVTVYADRGVQEPMRDSASSKMGFKFPFAAAPLSIPTPTAAQDPSSRFSPVMNNRLTM
jgi:hypothetical protein